jgi:hypothetical protein
MLVIALCLLAVTSTTATRADGVSLTALRARAKILELLLEDASKILDGAGDDAAVVIERARLALYRGDCDAASALLDRPDLAENEMATELMPIAKGCARATAAAVVKSDPRGVVVRFQDSADVALFPLLADTALAVRDVLARDLGTRLPDPIFIDLVRDQLSLAALSGLPERAAKTTGTVAVAKWGRVLMISPRATRVGFPWLDTLAHEMTHLVLSQATRDRAPLWLQEGVAKREEIRWRPRNAFDGIPSHHDVAATGIDRGLGLALTGLGPSIAMLPSAEHAMVAFAEVSSFIEYWVDNAGEGALPKLLATIRDAGPLTKAEEAIRETSGATLEEWEKRWRAWLATRPRTVPEEMTAKGPSSALRDAVRKRRLAELLAERGHAGAAQLEIARAHELLQNDAGVRCLFAATLRSQGEELAAARLVAHPKDIRMPTARWWSLHAHYQLGAALPRARELAIASSAYDPFVACDELPRGELPADAIRRELCLAARRNPWE